MYYCSLQIVKFAEIPAPSQCKIFSQQCIMCTWTSQLVSKLWWWFLGYWKIRPFTWAVGELALMLHAVATAFPSLLFHVGTINLPRLYPRLWLVFLLVPVFYLDEKVISFVKLCTNSVFRHCRRKKYVFVHGCSRDVAFSFTCSFCLDVHVWHGSSSYCGGGAACCWRWHQMVFPKYSRRSIQSMIWRSGKYLQ